MAEGKLRFVGLFILIFVFLGNLFIISPADGKANSQLALLPIVINTWPFTNATEKGEKFFKRSARTSNPGLELFQAI